MKTIKAIGVCGVLMIFCAAPRHSRAEAQNDGVQAFLDRHCLECHESVTKKGGLDLTELASDLAAPQTFAQWVAVHDRVSAGEMPPKTKPRPEPAELAA